jgi:hypothetical protein
MATTTITATSSTTMIPTTIPTIFRSRFMGWRSRLRPRMGAEPPS